MSASNAFSQPVILYGALRSGTTLFRLILQHHPALWNPGESDYLLDHITPDPSHPTGWRYDIAGLSGDRIFRAQNLTLPTGLDGRDLFEALVMALAAKRPDQRLILVFHRQADKAAKLLPEAPVLHLLRDPRDVARSSIGMGWAGNSYFGVDHWIGTERDWDAAAILDDRVLTVRYEDLMADFEADLARICGFLGLDFDPAMLTYHENSTYGPPDPGISQKWKSKATQREIALIEGRLGPLLEARGYEPAGPAADPHSLERVALVAESRIKRWRYNIRRYGLGLFFGHHAARILGLKETARKLAERQEAIQIANLK